MLAEHPTDSVAHVARAENSDGMECHGFSLLVAAAAVAIAVLSDPIPCIDGGKGWSENTVQDILEKWG